MKKIGFVDYYISEWHANNYPAWIKEKCEELGLEYEVAYAWAELDVSLVDKVTTAEWCEKYGVQKCDTIEELCEKSDVILVLAPSDPDKHLGYAEKVLPYGKRTYIDKTFAPDYKTACQIFDIAEKYGTPFFSSSALRFAEELNNIADPTSMITIGGGGSIQEYIVHQCEMVVKKMGTDIASVVANPHGTQMFITVNFESGKTATMIYGRSMPFGTYMANAEGKEGWKQVTQPFFKGLIADILNFYETGKFSFDGEETKAVIKLREMAVKASENTGVVVEA